MDSYAQQAEGEMWDAMAGVEPRDERRRLFVKGLDVDGHSVKVSRIVGTRDYVVAVDGVELRGYHDWTVDAVNAGRARVAVIRCDERNRAQS